MRKTGLIILMTAAALSMSACSRTEKPESTKPSGTVANEKETVKKTEKETEKATEKKTEAQTEDQTEKETETKETLSESESEAAATDENVLQLDAELSELLDKMYAIKGPDFDVETDTVDFDDEYAVSSYTGLTMDDVKKLDAAIVSEPMMGSHRCSTAPLADSTCRPRPSSRSRHWPVLSLEPTLQRRQPTARAIGRAWARLGASAAG